MVSHSLPYTAHLVNVGSQFYTIAWGAFAGTPSVYAIAAGGLNLPTRELQSWPSPTSAFEAPSLPTNLMGLPKLRGPDNIDTSGAAHGSCGIAPARGAVSIASVAPDADSSDDEYWRTRRVLDDSDFSEDEGPTEPPLSIRNLSSVYSRTFVPNFFANRLV
jgi:hypothetical protein